MPERSSELLTSEPETDLTVIDCVCDGRIRVGIDTCAQCAGTFDSVRVLLDAAGRGAGGNPVWILAWALAQVIGRDSVDWETVRKLAAEFEEPSRPQ